MDDPAQSVANAKTIFPATTRSTPSPLYVSTYHVVRTTPPYRTPRDHASRRLMFVFAPLKIQNC